MRTATLGLAAAILTAEAAAQKVVKLDTFASRPQTNIKKSKRATAQSYIFNDVNNGLYSIQAQIGTPGQSFTLQLDTGSTDIWVNSQNSQFCQKGNCVDSYSPSNSSTYKLSVRNEFNVTYGDGTGAAGDLFTDVLNVAGIKLTNQTFGLASTSDIPYGLMGVGMVGTEGSCNPSGSSYSQQQSYCYPNVLDTMVSQGKINSHAFSLYLNDISQSTGNILFGGVDSSRYTGDLVSVPMVGIPLQDGSQETDRYTVAWTNFTITTPNGVETFLNKAINIPALLDSGTTLAVLPTQIVNIIYQQMGAVEVKGSAYAPCYLRTSNATIDFWVGGPSGAVMRIPIREFLFNLDSTTASIWHRLGGAEYCEVGLEKGDDLPIFGDVILRSAYIVYDLDNRRIAIAKAVFNPTTGPNVQEITNGTSNNIPGVARTASAVSSSLSSLATASYGNVRSTGAGVGTATAGLTTASVVPLAAFTTGKYSGQGGYTAYSSITTAAPTGTAANGGGSSSSSSGAASAVTVPRLGFEGLAVAGLVSAFMAVGAGMVLL